MIQHAIHKNLNEFCEIVKSVEFVFNNKGVATEFRIDVLQDLTTKKFSTSVYVRDSFNIQPTFPQIPGSIPPAPQAKHIWVRHNNTPWVDADSADNAINQILSLLFQNP